MIALNSFLDVSNLAAPKKQDAFIEKAQAPERDDFRETLNKSMKANNRREDRPVHHKTDKVQRRDQDVKNDNQTREVKDAKDTAETKPVEKDEKADNVETKPAQTDDLNAEDKAFVEELAQKLNIDQDTLVNLLQVLNVDLNALKNGSFDEAAAKLKDLVENAFTKISANINFNVKETPSLNAKAHLVANIHAKVNDGEKSEQLNIHLNLKMNVKQGDKTDAKEVSQVQDQQPVNAEENDVLPELAKAVKDENKVDVKDNSKGAETVKQPARHADVSKAMTDGKDMDNKGQDNQPAESGYNVKSDKAAEQATGAFGNVKVVDLRTEAKAEGTSEISVDAQKGLPLQQASQTISRFAAIKHNAHLTGNLKENVFSQIVENAKLVLSDKQTEMELNLKPESLGKLSLKIATENGMVVAKITAESQQVKQVIESNLGQLKDSLQQQGLSIQEFSVSVGQDSKRELYESSQRFANSKGNKVSSINSNTVAVSENYAVRQMVRNPYLMSDSKVDFTA